MPRFNYLVKNSQGKTITGIVEGSTIKQAVSLLHDRGLYIIKLKEESIHPLTINIGSSGISFNDITHLTRQLSTMITAGLTLVEALSILLRQIKKKQVVKMLTQIEDDVRGGKSFAQALEKYPKIFTSAYIALVKAGEASGKLDVILNRLADNLEKSRDFINKVRSALIYPAIIIAGMIIVSIIVMTIVVPRLLSLYSEFNVALPLPTQIFISISLFFIKYWWAMLLVLLFLFFIFSRFRSTWIGKHLISTAFINLPVFGSLIREATLVEVTRTMAILVDGGVPILQTLEIAQQASSNAIYQEAIEYVARKVEKGYPLADPFIENNIFPPILGQMVAVGEQTGKLGESLTKLSRYFETEADSAVHNLTTMIEPLIMVILGIGVGFLVIAILLPIYSLAAKF